PIDIKPKDNFLDYIREGFDSQVILAAARAEFPFKGYLLGLVDEFEKIKKVIPNAQMKIVSEGEDIEVLKGRIDQLEPVTKKGIELSGWITYEELIEEIIHCRVFVGMATGLLDASKNYRISIPVKHTTEKCVASSFFYEKPLMLAEQFKTTENNRMYDLLMEALGQNFDEYKERCIASFEKIQEVYNDDSVMQQFLMCAENNKTTVFSVAQQMIHRFYQFANNLRFKDN
ncbi:MAG: hypothetical protein K6G30_11525, partial [Acetatifactor sp.]|nr:hypothetical protein [Acetatifactor sp.]